MRSMMTFYIRKVVFTPTCRWSQKMILIVIEPQVDQYNTTTIIITIVSTTIIITVIITVTISAGSAIILKVHMSLIS